MGKPAVAALSNLPTSHLVHSSSIKNPPRTVTRNTLETLAATLQLPPPHASLRRSDRVSMQRAAARVASLAIRRFASSAYRPALPTGVASLRPSTEVLNAGTRLSLQPTAAAAAALCTRRGYAGGARKKKAAVSENEDEDDEFEAMGSDGEYDDDEDLGDGDSDDYSEDDEEKPVKRGRC